MTSQGWLWPSFKTRFLEDLKRVHAKTGPWDLVVFSGDLTQKGAGDEYDKVTEALLEIWAVQRQLGFNPQLVAVPGNHDLARPTASNSAALVLRNWWGHEDARNATLSDPTSEYRQIITEIFSAYTGWKQDAAAAGLSFLPEETGMFPGDFSATLQTEAGSLGIVGLNSTWLQLAAGDFYQKLSIEIPQLLAVTQADPDAWRERHDRTLLVTHHPADWLHSTSIATWRAEINTTSRFDAHIFGHMHEPDVTSITSGGSRPRRSIQAASLFGLEKIDGKIERTNGYSVCAMDAQSGSLRVWPRINLKLTSGGWKLVADSKLDLGDDDSFILFGESQPVALPPVNAHLQLAASTLGETGQNPISARVLHTLNYHISGHRAHRDVRRVEQKRAVAALDDSRAVWLSAEWGDGAEGFLKSIIGSDTLPPAIYRLDLADYTSREEFLDEVKGRLGVSFEQLSADLAREGRAYLLLDNCPVSTSPTASGHLSPEADVEQMVEAILSFGPELRAILCCRRAPNQQRFAYVPLKPLDEADVRTYVLDHEKGGGRYGGIEEIGAIFRHTDGVPARIDATLRELEVVSISQLSSTNSDLIRTGATSENAPQVLRDAIDNLANSKDPDRKRAFALLKALLVFPHGETIERLRRFYESQAIFPGHALELLDAALVTTATPIGAQVGGDAEQERLLIVPRPVRDYLRGSLPAGEQEKLTKLAARTYFGENWMTSGIKKTVAERFAKPAVNAHETGNATSIILRLENEAIDADDSRRIEAALVIARGYISSLYKGHHYRMVLVLARDLLARLPEDQDEMRAFLNYQMGRALRMTGKHSQSAEVLESVDSTLLPSSMKRHLELTQALAMQSLGLSDRAVAIAKQLAKTDSRSSAALQAKAILLEENPNTTPDQFLALERKARRNDATVVANNLALDRAQRATTDQIESSRAFDEVLKSTGASDHYNHVRAIIRKIRLQKNNGQVTEQDKSLLIGAYHFLYNERLPGLFDDCHAALWDLFVDEMDQENLLRLFRHSSLIWRLRGDSGREHRYLQLLARHARTLIERDSGLLHRETAYYLVRANTVPQDGT